MARRSRSGALAATVAVAAVGSLLAVPGGVVAAPAAPSPAPEGSPSAGAAGVGDRLFPSLGNGGYDVKDYDLRIAYPRRDPRQTVTGSVAITAVATQVLTRFDLDFAGDTAGRATVDGRPAGLRRTAEELVITPRAPLARGQRFTVRVGRFTATPTRYLGRTEDSLFSFTRDGTTLAGQPDGAHRLFPSNDHPRDKARFRFRLTVPAGWTAVASGSPVGRPRAAGGARVWRYEQRQPMATQVAQIAVGDYTIASRGRVGRVVVRDVVPRRLADRWLPKLEVAASQLRWMRRRVGPYPFDRFGSLAVDRPFGEALEAQTLALYGAPVMTGSVADRDSVMLHELAHQWFGDDVAIASWDDLWLSEGHATWYEALYAEEKGFLEAATGFADLDAVMRAAYADSDRARRAEGAVARPDSVRTLFSGEIRYRNAALCIYALRHKTG